MRLLDSSLSRFSLQRWVAFVTGTGAMLVAVGNLFGYSLLYNLPLVQVLGEAYVLPILILAALFYATGTADSSLLRNSQIAGFAFGGLYLGVVASGEYMPSAVFVIFTFVLYYEYRTENLSSSWLVGLGGAYVVAIVVSIIRSARAVADDMSVSASVVGLAFSNIAVFTGSVVALFALVQYRQHRIRKRYSDELEERVAERTLELQRTVDQRDRMLQEIHHRVGNSLQLLASFVSLQQDNVGAKEKQVLKETELRVHAIADVHATLYSQHQLSHLPLADYAADLLDDMQIAYRSDAMIAVSIAATTDAHIDFAISFGIILNELVTNSVKHGAVEGSIPHVAVELAERGSSLELVVSDTGTGFLPGSRPGIGTEVVDQLVAQNSGQIDRMTDAGARILVKFPLWSVLKDERAELAKSETA
jgi:two-component sensor histidine kinase